MTGTIQAISNQDDAVLDLTDAELLDPKRDMEIEIRLRQEKEIKELQAKVARTAQELLASLAGRSWVLPQ